MAATVVGGIATGAAEVDGTADSVAVGLGVEVLVGSAEAVPAVAEQAVAGEYAF